MDSLPKQSEHKLLQARNYQIEMLEKAKRENTVVFLKTGSGKTFISILLLKTMMDKIFAKEKERKWGIFLCETVPIVDQQADEIKDQTVFEVGRYMGENGVQYWKKGEWEKELLKNHILVMTSAIFLDLLLHAYFKIDMACVIIFDECHHAVKNHPYNEIMKQVLLGLSNGDIREKPRILGMTSVIPNLSYNDVEDSVRKKISILEKNLDCKIYTTAYQEELNSCVVPPMPSLKTYKLNDKAHIYTLPDFEGMYQNHVLSEIVNAISYTYSDLGLWCTYKHLNSLIYTNDNKLQNQSIHGQKEEIDNLKKKKDYLEFLKSHLEKNVGETIMKNIRENKWQEEFFSEKVLELCDILKTAKGIEEFRGIIFVERRETAQILCDMIYTLSESLKSFNGFYKPTVLVGHGDRGLLKGITMGSNKQREIVKNFRNGSTNLLIATKVAEEGLDVQPCKLVVQFDGIKSIQSFVQSRGRARHGKSYYVILCDENDIKQKKMVENVDRLEKIINKITKEETNSDDESLNLVNEEEEENYLVPSTGAKATLHSSISLLYRYCQQLPSDKYYKLGVVFEFTEGEGGFQASAKLPKNAPIKEPIFGKKKSKRSLARQSAALAAIVKLHEQEKELDDNLLPCILGSRVSIETDIIDMGELKSYKKFIPESLRGKWELTETEQQEYHLYGISIVSKQPEDNQPPSIILGLATTTTFESCPTTLYDGKILEVTFSYFRKVMFNRERQELAKILHVQFFQNIIQILKDIPLQDNGKTYFILPIKDNNIDWSFIDTKKRQLASQLPRQKLLNKILTTTYHPRSYHVINIDTLETIHDDMSPTITYKKFYNSKKKIEILDEDQELVEAVQLSRVKNFLIKNGNVVKKEKEGIRLVPELCWVENNPFIFYEQGRYLPSVLHSLEKRLLSIDIMNQTNIKIRPELILEALSSPTGEGISYQRMETLGDAVLKHVVAVQLYFQYPNKHEGFLSMEKDKIIKNSSLYNWAILKNIHCYYTPNSFHKKSWFPPGFEDKEELVSKKSIADLVESITGACYLHGDVKCALDFLEWVGIPTSWAQYEKSQSEAQMTMAKFPEEFDLVESFSKKLNYKFRNTDLLLEAVSHTSYPHVSNYQRLEWLGDAVLDLLIVQHIYEHFPSANPGKITHLKHSACQNEVFCLLAYDNQFNKYLRHYSPVFNGVIKRFGEAVENVNSEFEQKNISYLQKVTILAERVEVPKLLGDLWESVAGAIFIDSGFDLKKVWQIYEHLMKDVLDCLHNDDLLEHPMTQLMKLLNQKHLGKELKVRKCSRENGFAKVQLIFKETVIGEDNTAQNNATSTKRAAKAALQYYIENEERFK